MTDGQLLERFLTSRDHEAFHALLRRHGPMVLGVCRQVLRKPQDAEDAFQATFLCLVRDGDSILNRESLGSWLYGVAFRTAMRDRARASRQRELVGQGAAIVAREPLSDPEAEEIRPILYDEVNRLPEKYRAPIVLCYLEGRTYEEAARLLDWPIGTVKGRLSRAREQLRGRLMRRGLALSMALMVFWLSREATAEVTDELAASTTEAALRAAADRPKPVASGARAASGRGRVGFALLRQHIVFLLALLAAAGGVSAAVRSARPLLPRKAVIMNMFTFNRDTGGICHP